MDIYWIEQKEKKGPATVPDVIARIQMGELSPDTMAWHKGCENWQPLKSLPALADFMTQFTLPKKEPTVPESAENKEPVIEPSAPDKEEPKTNSHFVPGIASRLLARFTDYALYASLVTGIIYLFKIPFNEFLLFSQPVFWLPSIILEAILLHQFGTTPGKRLMGISVTSLMGEGAPALHRSFSRSLGAFIMGMGCFIPLLSIITMAIAARMSLKGTLTLWDNRARTIALASSQKRPAPFLCLFIIFLSFHLVGFFLTPWIPDMMQQISIQAPEFAEWLQSQMQIQ